MLIKKVRVPVGLLPDGDLKTSCKRDGIEFLVGSLVREEFDRFSPADRVNFSDPIFAGIDGVRYVYVDFGPLYGVIKIVRGTGVEIFAET